MLTRGEGGKARAEAEAEEGGREIVNERIGKRVRTVT